MLCVGLSRGHLDEEGVGELRRTLFGLAANPSHRRAVLDLAGVDSLPVAAYPLLLALAHRWREAGGELRLCSPSEDVSRMVVALGLDRVLGMPRRSVRSRLRALGMTRRGSDRMVNGAEHRRWR